MSIIRAARADIAIVRARFAEVDHPPNYPNDDDLPIFRPEFSCFIGDGGTYGQGQYFPLDGISYIPWLLPEVISANRLAPLLLAILNDLATRFPVCLSQPAEATFHSGFDPVTSLEDFGWDKANRWADLVQGQGNVRPNVDEVFDPNGVRTGSRISMRRLAQGRALLTAVLGAP